VDLFPKSRNTVCPAPRIPGDRSFRAKDRVRQRADETEVTLDKPRGLIETRATCVTSDTTANAETARTGKKQHRFRCLSRRVRRVRALGSRVGGGRLHRLRKKTGVPLAKRDRAKTVSDFRSDDEKPKKVLQVSRRVLSERRKPVVAAPRLCSRAFPFHTQNGRIHGTRHRLYRASARA
jgi:hypothetical protein